MSKPLNRKEQRILSSLMERAGIAHGPREQDDQPHDKQDNPNQKDSPAEVHSVVGSKAAPAAHHSKQTEERWYRRIPWWKALEGLGIVAVVVYAVITCLQWRDLRHNFQIDQRAWVSISKFALDEEPSEGKTDINVRFYVINTGKTPALNCVVKKWPRLSSAPPDKTPHNTWPARPTNEPVFVVVPGAEQDKTYPWQPEARHIPPYRVGRYKLYVQAKVWYDDVFGVHHWATVCRSHEWHGDGRRLDDFGFCPDGTETGDEHQPSR